jgi:error-prone DNA polymerase
VEGRLQKSVEGVIHLMGTRVHDRSHDLDRLWDAPRAGLTADVADAGEAAGAAPGVSPLTPLSMHRHPRDVRILPKSRDFH